MKAYIFCIMLAVLSVVQLFSQEVVLINKTGFDLYNVYLTPSGLEQWSEDLQPFDVILSGQYKILDLSVYEGEYLFDFRFIDVDGDEYIKKNVDLNLHRKVVVSLDDLAYLMDTNKNSVLEDWFVSIRNNTGETITELYISPHNSNSWGTNLIQNDYLENKNSQQIFMNGAQEFIDYDVRMDTSDGDVYIKEILQLSNNITVILTPADRE